MSKGDRPAIISNMSTPRAHQSTLNPERDRDSKKECERECSIFISVIDLTVLNKYKTISIFIILSVTLMTWSYRFLFEFLKYSYIKHWARFNSGLYSTDSECSCSHTNRNPLPSGSLGQCSWASHRMCWWCHLVWFPPVTIKKICYEFYPVLSFLLN